MWQGQVSEGTVGGRGGLSSAVGATSPRAKVRVCAFIARAQLAGQS